MNNTLTSMQSYREHLKNYLEFDDPKYLFAIKNRMTTFIKQGLFPDELVEIHLELMKDQVYSVKTAQSFKFLKETLRYYRIDHQTSFPKDQQKNDMELESEIEVAANMQRTLLATEIPDIAGLDIGAISIPLMQMNGDYYHFLKSCDGILGVAIADVIGKGVPAALSMSMIKYALESFDDENMNPRTVLRYLNRVVERNVAQNMFITMFYGRYFPNEKKLRYSSAGHEPGFYYCAKTNQFTEIKAKGLVLGVLPHIQYEQYELEIDDGDMIVLLTDGVTECRHNNRFITREEVVEVIQLYDHLPAQEHAMQVYEHFNQLTDFELKDDFTLIIIKKQV